MSVPLYAPTPIQPAHPTPFYIEDSWGGLPPPPPHLLLILLLHSDHAYTDPPVAQLLSPSHLAVQDPDL
ncbi:hypothetical protein KUCAC02_000067 [Chaenocephalus aceratus]|nr:hypothetical protein KUCAC02_000067 [Chaenocephalus aceratus]